MTSTTVSFTVRQQRPTCDLPQLVLKPALKTPPPGSDMMDNGGYYCFCNLYGGCEAAAKVPMHVTIDLLQKYAPPASLLLAQTEMNVTMA